MNVIAPLGAPLGAIPSNALNVWWFLYELNSSVLTSKLLAISTLILDLQQVCLLKEGFLGRAGVRAGKKWAGGHAGKKIGRGEADLFPLQRAKFTGRFFNRRRSQNVTANIAHHIVIYNN